MPADPLSPADGGTPPDQFKSECDFVMKIPRHSPGGQHVQGNPTATVRHRPTGLSVTCSDHRSQLRNMQDALEKLRALVDAAPASTGEPTALANESWLAAEITRTWGAHGAHAEVFGMLLTRAGIKSDYARALPANTPPDPRDAEIARLRAEVERWQQAFRRFACHDERECPRTEKPDLPCTCGYSAIIGELDATPSPTGDARG